MNTVVPTATYVSRQDEACNLLANLAFSISGQMPVANACDVSSLVPYLVNASSSWAKTFVGLEIPIPKRFSNFQFVKGLNEQIILTEQTSTWSLSITEGSVEAMDFVGNRTSKRANGDLLCVSDNGSESHLMPGDTLDSGALFTESRIDGNLVINDLIVFSANGNRQAATTARYSAVTAASRLVDLSNSKSKILPDSAGGEQKIYTTYVQLEIIKQYCASLCLLKDAQSLTFAQSALESVLACRAERAK